MASTRPSRRCIAVVATLVVLAAAAHAGPVSAATSSPIFGGQFDTIPITVNGSYTPLPLHCFESYFDVLWYGRGSAPDSRWLDVDLAATPAVTSTTVPATVSGDYRPFVGDFDGDNCDDIFWYAPGPAPDFVWYFAPDHSYTSVAVTVNGDYVPIVGAFSGGPGPQDIYWYSPGAGRESMWLGNGSRLFVPSVAPQVNGTYTPVLFNVTSVLWYAPGTAQDYVTYPVGGSTVPTSTDRVTINGTYAPISLGGRVILYGPGPAADHLILGYGAERPDGSFALDTAPGSLNGTFVTGTTASVGSFGILHAPGPAQDYVIAS